MKECQLPDLTGKICRGISNCYLKEVVELEPLNSVHGIVDTVKQQVYGRCPNAIEVNSLLEDRLSQQVREGLVPQDKPLDEKGAKAILALYEKLPDNIKQQIHQNPEVNG